MLERGRQVGVRGGGRVLVIGGGLAGIAAAVRLADRGCAVTLIESKKRLGGRATSFVDPASGRLLDNCQHVLMGCCTNLLDLYARLGVERHIQWHRRLYFMHLGRRGGWSRWVGERGDNGRGNEQPHIDTLEADELAAPLHMTRSLMAFESLSMTEKLAISRGMLAIMRLGRAGRAGCHHTSFEQWLADHGQPAGAVEKFWAPVVVSALNEAPSHAAADYAMQVFQEGFLSSAEAYVMGLPTVPLVQLYDAAQAVIERAGGTVRLGVSADRLHYIGGRVITLGLAHGEQVAADAFVSALPFDRLAKVAAPDMYKADVRLRRLDRFASSPILGIHLWFECPPHAPVMTLPHLVLTGSPLQWVFNKGHDGRTQHLHGVISAAHEFVSMESERIVEIAAGELRKALPGARRARLAAGLAIKEKRATFSPRPGIDAARPAAAGAIENLYLAGDFCRSGWPATMEGAVRSGYLAAAALLRDAGADSDDLAPDLSPDAMYKLIGG